MAEDPDGGDIYSLPKDQLLKLAPPLSHQPAYTHDKLVREALGNNQCVLLTGHHLEGPTSMSSDELVAWRGSLNQDVICMG